MTRSGSLARAEFVFDEQAADRACEFFTRYLRHQKGELAGRPLELADWQINEIVRPLFGWKRRDGTRRYRTCYVEIPRKNGKTTIAAGIGLYLLFADGEQGAEIYSAAADREQAAIAFDLARSMVEAEPELRKRAKVFRRSIVVEGTGSSYKVLSADARSKHGFNAHGIILDEVHAQPNRELYDVLHTSTGARRQPVEFLITTAGVFSPESIAWQLHEYAGKVRDGSIVDPTFLPVIYGAPVEADYRDGAVQAAANPGIGISVKADYLMAESKRAEEEPSYENTFRRLHLNQWTQQVTRWLKIEDWQACADRMPDLTGRECFPALDMSTTTDITALVLAFPPRDDYEPTWLLPFFWCPEDTVMKASRRDRVPYDAWVRDYHMTATPGNVIDYKHIRQRINELSKVYKFGPLAYDPWNATQLATQLQDDDGFTMAEFRQGYISMNEPAKELERLIVGHRIAHPDNPALNWMVSNATIVSDPAGNIKPTKEKSTGRIDGVVAAVMAVGMIIRGREAPDEYLLYVG
jgi:phage terminase large subunit-like protein